MDKLVIKDMKIHEKDQAALGHEVIRDKYTLTLELLYNIKTTDGEHIKDTLSYEEIANYSLARLQKGKGESAEGEALSLTQMLLLDFPLIEEVKASLGLVSPGADYSLGQVSYEVSRRWNTVYLSLSSNDESKDQYLNFAIDQIIENKLCRFLKVSDFYPDGDEKDASLTAVLEIQTLMSPEELLNFVRKVESDAGRDRATEGSRKLLDLDILLFGNEMINSDELTVPHNKLEDREYVLAALNEIAPYARNPVTNLNPRDMLNLLKLRNSGVLSGLHV